MTQQERQARSRAKIFEAAIDVYKRQVSGRGAGCPGAPPHAPHSGKMDVKPKPGPLRDRALFMKR